MTEQQHLPYDSLLNHTLQALPPSGIRRFFDIANEMEDVISLSIGEPDFATPWHIREAGIRSLQDKKTWYTPNAGLMELRETIGTYVKRKFDVEYVPKTEILVTVGGSEAIDMALRAVINPGDEVLVPEPSFVCYAPLAAMAVGKNTGGRHGGADSHQRGKCLPTDAGGFARSDYPAHEGADSAVSEQPDRRCDAP